ncbi:MAG: hypothetical protein QXO68_00545 [Conexivisphaerales archaeon]
MVKRDPQALEIRRRIKLLLLKTQREMAKIIGVTERDVDEVGAWR